MYLNKIAVLGLGHVGLPTSLGLASLGLEVIGADEDSAKVSMLKRGEVTFFEPGLHSLLGEHLRSGRFTATDDVAAAVRAATVILVCVGTPQRDDGAADLTQIEAIARTIGKNLNGYKLIVEKSTVPAITAVWIKKTIQRYVTGSSQPLAMPAAPAPGLPPDLSMPSGVSFDVASNPEFLQEGKALENFFHPDRVVIGVESERAREILESIYRPLQCPIVVTDITTAELIKHAANAFLSNKISFINLVADLCDVLGADVTKVSEGLGLDPRIGPDFLKAGIGFGGYCFPKDLRAFIRLAEEHGVECSLLHGVETINSRRVEVFMKKLKSALWIIQDKTIGVLGLAFKPQTDDIREAPSLKIVEALLREGASLRLHDPKAMPEVQRLYPEQPGRLVYCATPYEVARGAEAILILTDWDDYRRLDLAILRDLMEVPLMVDGRNAFDPAAVTEAGLEYIGVGRRTGSHAPQFGAAVRNSDVASTAGPSLS